MKLADHVQIIKDLIEKSFDKEFSKLGILSSSKKDVSTLPANLLHKREKFENILDSHEKEMGSYEKGRERAIDELTFTLFNRIAAIKVMEAKELFPPIITKSAEHGNRSFGHKVWLEENPNMMSADFEGIRDYIIYAFDNLGETLPLYNKKYPYALLPDVVALNDIIEKFNSVEKDTDIEENIWANDDILGWLYENYNNDKKKEFKDSNEKTEYSKVSLQSQFYTPRWVVEFLVNNSLGKLYMEMYPDSNIWRKIKIANLNDGIKKEPKPITEFKTIDPACGSGNFLLYTFDLLYDLYQDQIDNYGLDMDEKDIPQNIIENNIYGIDLDDRAIQLAQLGLYIKARTKKRNIKNLNFNVVSSAFFLPDYEKVADIFETQDYIYQDQKNTIRGIWEDLKFAYKFGSLIRLREHFDDKIASIKEKWQREGIIQTSLFEGHEISKIENLKKDFFIKLQNAVDKYAESNTNTFLCKQTTDAIKFLKALTSKFDVTTTNPPYTNSSDFGADLKKFIDSNYSKPLKFNNNLYSTFIKRCYELIENYGKMALVHPPTFMYIKTFEDTRKFILDNTSIQLFVEWGYLGMFSQTARVDSAMYIFDKAKPSIKSTFIKLNELYEGERYNKLKEAYSALLSNKKQELLYQIKQEDLNNIKSTPFIYWISDNFRKSISSNIIDNILDVRAGIQTSCNERFLRFWWEIVKDNNFGYWKTYAKGGDYQKWYGNLWLTINWKDEGKFLQAYLKSRGQDLHAQEYYYKEGVTYTASGSKGASFRYLPEGCLFDIGGSCVFPNKYTNILYYLAYLNSKLNFYILNECLNPTANKQPNDIKRVPFAFPSKDVEKRVQDFAERNINITEEIKSYTIYERIFKKNPLFHNNESTLSMRIKKYLDYENLLNTEILINESIINNLIFEVYDLTKEDKDMVISSMGESLGNLPCDINAKNEYLKEVNNTSKEFNEFVNNIPIKEFSFEDKQQIINDFPSLYQNTNDLEAFCNSHNVNPINIWYWFKLSSVIPSYKAKDIIMELLVYVIRDVLSKDDDGIIPLTQNVGEEYLYGRIENAIYNLGFNEAQFGSIDGFLGKQLKQYLEETFFGDFSDHLNIFQNLPKTPFIWHITSGKEKAFECFVSIYKWSRDNLMRLRSVYVEHRERSLINRESDLLNNNSAQAQAEKAQIKLQLEELKEFKNKIDDLLASGYDPKLDDGVGKNIAPLQKRKMLSYEVLNAGQLKKYLNADW